MTAKLSPELNEELEKIDASDLLDVIVEVRPHTISVENQAARPRNERITALKEAFAREVEPVEAAVRGVGGQVTGRAWINHTLRARIPAQSLRELALHESVAALDIPHALAAEQTT